MKTQARVLSITLFFVTASATALAADASSTAPPESAVEKARNSFQQGVQLFHEGSFEAALSEFRKAYRLAPSYRILYNIAQAYYELHDYVSASKALKQYTTDGGNDISSSRRAQVDEINQKLDARIAYLDILINEDGADIRIDDLSVGTSPLPAPIAVNAGPRRISAVKPGFAVAARNLTAAGGDRIKVILDLPEPEVARAGDQRSPASRALPDLTNSAEPASSPIPTPLLVTLAATTAGAVATGVFVWLAIDAKKDFDNRLSTFGSTRTQIDSDRSRMKNYALLADGFGAATLVAGGVSVYLALTRHGSVGHRAAERRSSLDVSPTLGGMVVHGSW
jgi:hypothetical protein